MLANKFIINLKSDDNSISCFHIGPKSVIVGLSMQYCGQYLNFLIQLGSASILGFTQKVCSVEYPLGLKKGWAPDKGVCPRSIVSVCVLREAHLLIQ